MNILFLEDEVELNQLGSMQLESLGHTVFSAKKVGAARDIIAEHGSKIDLIIADHCLPDGTGIGFLMEMRIQQPSVKMAVVSAFLTGDDKDLLDKYNIPHFSKPLLYSKVLETLKEKTKPPPVHPKDSNSNGEDAKPTDKKSKDSDDLIPVKRKKGLTSVIFDKLMGE